jgi:hypothetical protein
VSKKAGRTLLPRAASAKARDNGEAPDRSRAGKGGRHDKEGVTYQKPRLPYYLREEVFQKLKELKLLKLIK